jgi:5,10-methenyltetrahydrofolate synthetase
VNVASDPAAARAGLVERRALRARLIAGRDAFVASAGFAVANEALAAHLRTTLVPLEPACLGLCWPMRSEFNAVAALAADEAFDKVARALPYARRESRVMEFRHWNGEAPSTIDECGIATSDGAVVVPDVVVVPCLGFTRGGHRLGSGGGYFDRWLAAHPHVVAVGVAWDCGELDPIAFAAQPHDVPLAFVVTESGVR